MVVNEQREQNIEKFALVNSVRNGGLREGGEHWKVRFSELHGQWENAIGMFFTKKCEF